ncbi:MAG: Gfo/Idh/MocA family oxidoreductase [Woeseiaceae bacterium]|nr:Gfo/Idh/MocA family oxidoreductase [Woeseiaceae bacterium]
MKLIQAGIGTRGGHWIEFINARDDVDVVACVDTDDAALEKVRAAAGCETFHTLGEALQKVEADGVIVASPSLLHGEHSIQALRAGLAVMVEKPLAATFQEAVDVVATSIEVGRPVMVAENYRFFQAERTLRKLLDEGKAGKIDAVFCVDRRDQPSGSQGQWVKSMPEPFLTEIAVHHFDSFRYLFNAEPASVWARSYNPAGSDYAQNAAAEALIQMRDGLSIQYSGSFVGSRYDYDLLICGEDGDLRTNRSKVWWRASGSRSFGEVALLELPEGEVQRYPNAGMQSLLNQFRDVIQGRAVPETSGADNLWTLAMYEAALQSANSGETISIEQTFTSELQQKAGVAGRDR